MTVPFVPPEVVSMTRVVRLTLRSSWSKPRSSAQYCRVWFDWFFKTQPPASQHRREHQYNLKCTTHFTPYSSYNQIYTTTWLNAQILLVSKCAEISVLIQIVFFFFFIVSTVAAYTQGIVHGHSWDMGHNLL